MCLVVYINITSERSRSRSLYSLISMRQLLQVSCTELIRKLHIHTYTPACTHTCTHGYVAPGYRVSGASTYVCIQCGDGNQCAITCRVIYNQVVPSPFYAIVISMSLRFSSERSALLGPPSACSPYSPSCLTAHITFSAVPR